MSRLPRTFRPGLLAARLALALGGSVLALLAFEGVARLVTPPTIGSGEALASWLEGQVVFDPILGWRNEPGVWQGRRESGDGWEEATYRVGPRGFRGPDFPMPKPDGAFRIVCMGDSGTFGTLRAPPGMPGPEYFPVPSYVDALRDRFAREGLDPREVINAGVIGYTSHHGLRQFMVEILDLEPDVVTLRFGANDVQADWPQPRIAEPGSPLLRFLIYRFAHWRTTRVLLGSPVFLRLLPAPAKGDRATPEQYRRNLERIIERSRARGIHVLLMDYPVRGGAWPKLKVLQQETAEVAARHDVPFLQTGPRLATDGGRSFHPHDRIHPSQAGAERTAELLFEGLRDLGWLPRRRAEPAAR